MPTFAEGSWAAGGNIPGDCLLLTTSRVKPLSSLSTGFQLPRLPCGPTAASALVTQRKSSQVLTVTYRTLHDASPSSAAQASPSAQKLCSPYPVQGFLIGQLCSPGDIWRFQVATTGVCVCVLLVPSGQRAGMLLKTPQSMGQLPNPNKDQQCAGRWRHPDLVNSSSCRETS